MSTTDTYREKVVEAVAQGVRATLSALEGARRHERVSGYALITDDDVSGVSYLACTEEHLAAAGPEYQRLLGPEWTMERAVELMRFMAVDWAYDYERDALDPASVLLRASHEAATTAELFATHVDVSFRAVVEGLLVVRREGAFADEVFLSALSTDPSDHLLDLEQEGVRILNVDTLFRRWEATIRSTNA